jgi:hypothetical protein
MKKTINNFCDTSPMNVESVTGLLFREYSVGVRLFQSSGSLQMQQDMTCQQAREMAAALIACADAAEADGKQEEAAE